MTTSAGTDFRIPPPAHWSELCDLSDALRDELGAGEEREASGLERVRLPAVWTAMTPLRSAWIYAPNRTRPKFRSKGWSADDEGKRIDLRVPSDERWRTLRDKRSTRAVELDLIALLPPDVLVEVPSDTLCSLGAGGRAIADMDRPARAEALLAGRTWDNKEIAKDRVEDWDEREANLLSRTDFYGPVGLHPDAAVDAVRRFLALERRLLATDFSATRRRDHPDLGLKSTIDPLYRDLQSASEPGIISSLGTIRVKLLRVTAHRLAGRSREAKQELIEATTDLVYAPEPSSERDRVPRHASSGAWLNLMDRACEEWAYLDPDSPPGGPDTMALVATSWLLPQVLRLGHTRPTPYLRTNEDGSGASLVPGNGKLRSSVLTLLVDRLRTVDRHQSALKVILGVARCPLLWGRLARSGEHLGEWTMLARWAQAAYLRTEASSARTLEATADAQEAMIRLTGILDADGMSPRLGRFDAMVLDQQALALRHALNPAPKQSTLDHPLTGPARRALPIRRQGDRAQAPQRQSTDRSLAQALRDIWADRPVLTPSAGLLEQVAAAAGKGKKTVLTNRPKGYGGCVEYARARLILDLIDTMSKSDKIAAGDGILSFYGYLREFHCSCADEHDLALRLAGWRLATMPRLDEMVGSTPEELEQFALHRAQELRTKRDVRWRLEMEWAALHAATARRSKAAAAYLSEALHGSGASEPVGGWRIQLLTLAALGETSALTRSAELIAELGGEPHWLILGRAIQFARDLDHPTTADALYVSCESALTQRRISDTDLQLELLGILALDVRRTVSMERLARLVNLAAQHSPTGTLANIAVEVLNSMAAACKMDDAAELASLRAAWRYCAEASALEWAGVMASPIVDRLTDLERRVGDPVRAEMVERRCANRTITKWLDPVPPTEATVWGDLVARGREHALGDEIRPDPEDPLFGADLVPRTATAALHIAIADLTLAVLDSSDTAVLSAPSALASQIENVVSRSRGLPIRVTPHRDCTETMSLERGLDT